jgi:transcriptional regulator with XRE-family HTH domain
MQEKYNVNTTFSERIQIILKKLNVSRKDFAHIINVSYGNLSDWLNGRSEPSAKAIRAIYYNYDVNPIWLLTGEGPFRTPDYLVNDSSELYNKVQLGTSEYNDLLSRAKKYDQIVKIIGRQIDDD